MYTSQRHRVKPGYKPVAWCQTNMAYMQQGGAWLVASMDQLAWLRAGGIDGLIEVKFVV